MVRGVHGGGTVGRGTAILDGGDIVATVSDKATSAEQMDICQPRSSASRSQAPRSAAVA
jgi:hypothetical protein